MTYQFSRFNQQTTVSLEEAYIVVITRHKGKETARRFACAAIKKIHLSANGSIAKCIVFFKGDSYILSISSIDVHAKLVRARNEQLVAYRRFVEALHRKLLEHKEQGKEVAFVCGNTLQMTLLMALIAVIFLVIVPMAISIKRYEVLLLLVAPLVVLFNYMRKTGFTRSYQPADQPSLSEFLPK